MLSVYLGETSFLDINWIRVCFEDVDLAVDFYSECFRIIYFPSIPWETTCIKCANTKGDSPFPDYQSEQVTFLIAYVFAK